MKKVFILLFTMINCCWINAATIRLTKMNNSNIGCHRYEIPIVTEDDKQLEITCDEKAVATVVVKDEEGQILSIESNVELSPEGYVINVEDANQAENIYVEVYIEGQD